MANGEVGVVLRLEEVVGFGFVAGAEEFAFVGGDAGVEDAPVDVRPAAGFAGVEHVVDAFGAPLGAVGLSIQSEWVSGAERVRVSVGASPIG